MIQMMTRPARGEGVLVRIPWDKDFKPQSEWCVHCGTLPQNLPCERCGRKESNWPATAPFPVLGKDENAEIVVEPEEWPVCRHCGKPSSFCIRFPAVDSPRFYSCDGCGSDLGEKKPPPDDSDGGS